VPGLRHCFHSVLLLKPNVRGKLSSPLLSGKVLNDVDLLASRCHVQNLDCKASRTE